MATKRRRKDQTREDLRLDFFNQLTPITRIQGHVYEVFNASEVEIDREESTVEGLQSILHERIEIVVDGEGKVVGQPTGSAIEKSSPANVDTDLRWVTHWKDGSSLPTYYLGEALDRLADYDSAYDVPSN